MDPTLTSQSGPSDESSPSIETAVDNLLAGIDQQEEGAESPAPEKDIWAQLDELDPDEVMRKSRKIAGKVGELADRQARARAQVLADEIRENERKAEDERKKKLEKRTLLKSDPDAFLAKAEEEFDQEDETEAEQAAREKTSKAVWTEVDAAFTSYFYELPPEVQQKLGGRTYQGTPGQARLAFLKDVTEALAEVETSKRVQAETKKLTDRIRAETLEALRKDDLTKQNGQDPVSSGNGGVPPAGALTSQEFQRNRGSREWRIANKDRINAWLAAGSP